MIGVNLPRTIGRSRTESFPIPRRAHYLYSTHLKKNVFIARLFALKIQRHPNMAWIFLFWFLMFAMNLTLIVSSFYQLLCLVDLESDDLNPFEASSCINFWVEPEFLLQGLFCILLLVTGHWIMFLLAVPLVCYHVNLYIKRKHLIDVTEVFRNLKVEKKFRLVKLGFYVIFFVLIVFKIIAVVKFWVYHTDFGDLDIRFSVLEH